MSFGTGEPLQVIGYIRVSAEQTGQGVQRLILRRTRGYFGNFIMGLFGIGLLVFLFTRLEDPQALWQQLLLSNKWYLVGALAAYALAVAMNGVKWGILLYAVGIRVVPRRLFAYQWVAEFFNNFLPAQVGGDVMRGYALASDTRRHADAAASVLIDRFMGLFIFMLTAAMASSAMLIWGRPNGAHFSGNELATMRIMALGSVSIAAVLVGMLAAVLSRRLKHFVERLLVLLPLSQYTVPGWQKLSQAFNAYRYRFGALLQAAQGSLLILLVASVQIWLISEAISPDSVSLLEVLVINPILVLLLVAVPLSPGGLGVRQGAFSVMFFLIGAGGDLGYGVGLLQQFIVYLVSLPGLVIWVRGRQRITSSLDAAANPEE